METPLWWRSIAQQAEQRVPSRRRRRSAPDNGTSLCLTIPGDGDAGALRVCALAWQVPAFPCAHASVRQARPGQASSRWVRQVVCFGWSESWSDGLTTCPGRHAGGWAIDRPLAEERPSRLSPSNAGNKKSGVRRTLFGTRWSSGWRPGRTFDWLLGDRLVGQRPERPGSTSPSGLAITVRSSRAATAPKPAYCVTGSRNILDHSSSDGSRTGFMLLRAALKTPARPTCPSV